MTEQEYKKRLSAINEKYEADKKALYKEFALSNAKFKVGDIIKDSRGIIKIEIVTGGKLGDLPETVYKGRELKKDLTPRKDKNILFIWGNDVELIKAAE